MACMEYFNFYSLYGIRLAQETRVTVTSGIENRFKSGSTYRINKFHEGMQVMHDMCTLTFNTYYIACKSCMICAR